MRSVELICSFSQVSVAKPEKSRFDPKEVRGNVLKHLLQPENLNNIQSVVKLNYMHLNSDCHLHSNTLSFATQEFLQPLPL